MDIIKDIFTVLLSYLTLPHIATLVTIICAIIVILATSRVNKIRTAQAEFDRDYSEKRANYLKLELDNKRKVLLETKEIANDISYLISQRLIEDPSWLDRFMDQTGITYSASVFGNRIGHFYYEKMQIAKNAVMHVDKLLAEDNQRKVCLLIDSGTTMYSVFEEIAKKVHEKNTKWKKNKVCIVSNNIPGIQHLMKNGKNDPSDNYSEILIDCFILPGKPLSVYAAITGEESIKWLKADYPSFLKTWGKGNSNIITVCFITGNYITKSSNKDRTMNHYRPAARGEGHVEIKNQMVEISDYIFILSPLAKFSFASTSLLNKLLNFNIPRKIHEELNEEALKRPREVQYEEIGISDDKNIRVFTTRRPEGNMFHQFSVELYNDLITTYGESNIEMPEMDIRRWIPNLKNEPRLEFDREIPHENLRKTWGNENENIWNFKWTENQERQLKDKIS